MEKIDFKIKRKISGEEAAAFEIVKTLQDAGFEAYIAGGAVRDLYLGKDTHDIDIATSARPEEIKELFPKSYDRGKTFGVVAVQKEKNLEFEIATFRNDLGIADHRRPQKIEFTTAENDAQRRDFTINALFYDSEKSQIIDFVEGISDLKKKVIRFVGKPNARIDEDYLRMLRAVRFAYRLEFKINEAAVEAIKKDAHKITEISAERIREELTNILTGCQRTEALKMLDSLGLLEAILPEAIVLKGVEQPPEFHSEGDVWTHTLLALESLGNPPAGGPSAELAWTVLLHDIAKPQTQGFRDHPKSKITFFEHDVQSAEMAKEILERLKFSNDFINACAWAISQHMRIIHAFSGMSERKQLKLFTHPHINLLLDLTRADLGSSRRPGNIVDMKMYEEAIEKQKQFEKQKDIQETEQVKKFTLATGNDIMKILHLSPGPKVGEIKQKIENAFLDGKISTRSEALKMIEELK